jgi:hypothetical protein
MLRGSSGNEFVDPRPGLEAAYEAEIERLRPTFEGQHGLTARWRWWRTRRRLYHEIVTRPLRSARW